MNIKEALKEYFGYDEFRTGQEELIAAVLLGRDVLGVMPTGAGKSLCYQIPALLLPGITLVISPLISLMKDQVNALSQAGISADFINSSLGLEEYNDVFRRALAGEIKIIYVAPERLETDRFIHLAENSTISFVAVDEAHCVSQWGQDFRPGYLKIAEFIARLPYRPAVGAFTATATVDVKRDIIKMLSLQNPLSLTTGFDRENLYFDVVKPKNKLQYLRELIRQRRGKSGIIYCATRSSVERVCADLQQQGTAATRYHAGLSDKERRQNQDDFIYDRSPVMVATNAFGMGIDKSNVNFVIHYNMPKNLESYYQEAGRAGRDGTAADCILLFSAADINTAKFLIQNSEDGSRLSSAERAEVQARDMERLETMIAYCKTRACLRAYILEYFGEAREGGCTNCGNCKGEFESRDITLEAQKILSCVARVDKKFSYGLGANMYALVLRGSRSQRIYQLGLDSLPTYNIMPEVDSSRLQSYIEFLVSEDYLQASADEFPVLHLTEKSGEVLFHGKTVTMPIKKQALADKTDRRSRTKNSAPLPEAENNLFEALKTLRAQLARDAGIPAYIVFSNATLVDMAEKAPRTMLEFLDVSGVGDVKATRYGEEFLKAINDFSTEAD
ncbi:MAG: DNA helicase RecQ [Oscillospiraceae bacterium]